MLFHIRDLSIRGFWYPWGLLGPTPCKPQRWLCNHTRLSSCGIPPWKGPERSTHPLVQGRKPVSMWILLISPPLWTIQVQWDYSERGRHQHHINTSLPDNTTEDWDSRTWDDYKLGGGGFHAQTEKSIHGVWSRGGMLGGWSCWGGCRMWDLSCCPSMGHHAICPGLARLATARLVDGDSRLRPRLPQPPLLVSQHSCQQTRSFGCLAPDVQTQGHHVSMFLRWL